MTSVLTFLAGCVTGLATYSIIFKLGVKTLGKDAIVRSKFLDGLGYDALIQLRDAANEEAQKRAGQDS